MSFRNRLSMLGLGAALALTPIAAPANHGSSGGSATRTVALAALTDGGLAAVDPVRGKLLRRLDGLTEATFGIVVNPLNPAQAFAVAENAGQLFEIDIAGWAVKGAPIALSGDPARPLKSHQPVMTADGRYVIVTVPGDETLTVVDVETRAVSKIPLPGSPHIVDIDRPTSHLFVSRKTAGAAFVDFEKVRARFDLAQGVTLGAADVAALTADGAYILIAINGAPRVVSAMGDGRFAIAMYGKRGPLTYEVRSGAATLLDDLDQLIKYSRPRAPKANMEYLEAQACSKDGRTLVGTDQGIPPYLRVWEMARDGRGLWQRAAIRLPAEPYWVNVSDDGATAWVSIPKYKDAGGADVTGSVLTVDLRTGRILQSVAIDDDGKAHSPKRMVVVQLPASFFRP